MQFVSFDPELASQLELLFAPSRPIPIRLWAILDGTSQGRILVDKPTQPTYALVQELAEGTTYIGGHPAPEVIAEGISILRAYQEVVLCLWPDDQLSARLPIQPYYHGAAIDFTNRSPGVDLDGMIRLPSGYRFRRIDAEITPLLEGFDYYVAMYGSVNQAIKQTIGYCLLRDETVVCEAVAGPLTRGIAEIGVGTNKAYQGKGFATMTSARVIQECEIQGYRAFWNASQQNLASIALARRLGFQTEKPFTVLAWSAVR